MGNPALNKCINALILFIVLLSYLQVTRADTAPDDKSTFAVTEEEYGHLYSWLKHGKLFYHTFGPQKRGEYVYDNGTAHRIAITTPEQFAIMIGDQFDDGQSIEAFLKEMFPKVFFSFMGPSNSSVIDKQSLHFLNSMPSESWKVFIITDASKNTFTWLRYSKSQIRDSLDTWAKYEYKGIDINNGKW